MQLIKIKDIHENKGQIEGVPANPRQWKRDEVAQLAKSIQETPELFDLRPIIVYDNVNEFVVLGGNMRLAAAKHLGRKEVPCEIVSRETPPAKLKEIVIKDNGAFGAWDFDALANEWDDLPLADWGVKGVPDTFESESEPTKDLSNDIAKTYIIEIECNNESEQEIIYNELIERGYICRILTL